MGQLPYSFQIQNPTGSHVFPASLAAAPSPPYILFLYTSVLFPLGSASIRSAGWLVQASLSNYSHHRFTPTNWVQSGRKNPKIFRQLRRRIGLASVLIAIEAVLLRKIPRKASSALTPKPANPPTSPTEKLSLGLYRRFLNADSVLKPVPDAFPLGTRFQSWPQRITRDGVQAPPLRPQPRVAGKTSAVEVGDGRSGTLHRTHRYQPPKRKKVRQCLAEPKWKGA